MNLLYAPKYDFVVITSFKKAGRLVGICLLERNDWLYDDLSVSVIVAFPFCEPLGEENWFDKFKISSELVVIQSYLLASIHKDISGFRIIFN